MSDLATVAQRIAARTWGGRWIADETTIDEHESAPLDEQEEREAA